MRCTCDDIVDDNGCFEPPCPIHGNQNQPDLPTRLRELAEEMRSCANEFSASHLMAENLEEWSYDVDGTADEIAAELEKEE